MTESKSDLEVEVIEIDELVLDDDNDRDHTKGVDELAESLTQFGQRKPVVVFGKNLAIAGNGLVLAAKSLGWTHIAIARCPLDWDIAKARAFALADNRTAELSSWNLSRVTEHLFTLNALKWDMNALGFEHFNMPKTISFDVSPQLGQTGYAVIIDCDDEEQQSALLKRFEKQRLHARALMT